VLQGCATQILLKSNHLKQPLAVHSAEVPQRQIQPALEVQVPHILVAIHCRGPTLRGDVWEVFLVPKLHHRQIACAGQCAIVERRRDFSRLPSVRFSSGQTSEAAGASAPAASLAMRVW